MGLWWLRGVFIAVEKFVYAGLDVFFGVLGGGGDGFANVVRVLFGDGLLALFGFVRGFLDGTPSLFSVAFTC